MQLSLTGEMFFHIDHILPDNMHEGGSWIVEAHSGNMGVKVHHLTLTEHNLDMET